MSKIWTAVITEVPDEESHKAYPTDPQDWTVELHLQDETDLSHEIIYVTFTGTIGDADEVIMTPEEVIEARIEAMLKGLNS